MKPPSRQLATQAIAHIAVAAFELRHNGDAYKLSQRIDAMLFIISNHMKLRKNTIKRLAGLPNPTRSLDAPTNPPTQQPS